MYYSAGQLFLWKINLSIKKADRKNYTRQDHREGKQGYRDKVKNQPDLNEDGRCGIENIASGADAQFEEKLKKFMQESDSRIASNPMYAEHRKKTRRR